jgi:hypothetical protein
MKKTPDYQIVVPSRRRPSNMLMLRELLPTALICVDAREEKDYAAVDEKKNLLVHPIIARRAGRARVQARTPGSKPI